MRKNLDFLKHLQFQFKKIYVSMCLKLRTTNHPLRTKGITFVPINSIAFINCLCVSPALSI